AFAPVMFGGKEMGIDVKGRCGVSGGDRYVALAVGTQDVADGLESRFTLESEFLAGFERGGGKRSHQDLGVGPVQFGGRFEEADDVVRSARQRPLVGGEVLDSGQRLLGRRREPA